MIKGSFMRAMAINAFGGGDQLKLIDLPSPEPGPDEIRVKLQYAAVNPAEWKFREGFGQRFASFKTNFPFVLGLEGAGTIDKVGASVTQFVPGDRVVFRCDQRSGAPGSYAEFAVTKENAAAKIPDGISITDAATMPVAGLTAYQAVAHTGGVAPGQVVLVHGAAGGVGGFAVQFAKVLGAQVAATCNTRNGDYVGQMGADHLIFYDAGSITDAARLWRPEGFDSIIDCVGYHSLKEPLSLLKSGGIDVRIITLSDSDDESPTSEEAEREGKRAMVKVVDRATAQADMREILKLMVEGKVKPPEVTVLPLVQVAEAHRLLEERQVRGKLLLQVA
ncbi:NADP-dependent oxidoreductase (plasmid) [Sphingomonas paeninsulae]|uniref:NADP-dependent oxidoreductase n=1 Tax=Sphingomonas paeninsulae TaxID=2319844 RepID=A0A494TBS6_SPHPE|nr:NADP-dependent oxidoreductase [Sphingomonas paeninsulae]AYJ84862.1 NADP-dependent oxidoreductase [Sphingomonas paeninsulae]